MTEYKVLVFVDGDLDWSSSDQFDEPPNVTVDIQEVTE